jgi:hypothetical protein
MQLSSNVAVRPPCTVPYGFEMSLAWLDGDDDPSPLGLDDVVA